MGCVATLAASACSGGHVVHTGEAKTAASIARAAKRGYATPATLFATTDPASVNVALTEPDGRKLIVSHGMRMVQLRDGSLERAMELLPAKEAVRIVQLPPRLGDGYLFYITSSSTTMIWSARQFTGRLTPLANLDFGVDNIVAGFDRLYLQRTRSKLPVALDAASGEVLELGPLPLSPSYEAMAFADAWMGAVLVPLRGVLATFDAGTTWLPVPGASRVVSTDQGPVLRTEDGWGLLTPSGVLRRFEFPDDEIDKLDQLLAILGKPFAETEVQSGPVQRTRPRPLGRDPLRLAVLHGVMGPSGSAYAAHLGSLARVSLENGKLLEVIEHAFPADANCHGIRLGRGYGFVCSQERGPTTVYALEAPLALRKVLAFGEPRYIADSEFGGLVIRGRCSEDKSEPGYYCLMSERGLREIRVRGDVGAERVALYPDGSAAVLVPPRKGAAATLTRVALDGSATQTKLKLPKSGPVANLVREGIWLDGFTAAQNGELRGWVAGTGPFVGIRIKRDGTVTHGEVQNDIERTLISGRFALMVAQYGQALETTDGGFTWAEVPTLQASENRQSLANLEQGCSAIGCATTQWIRVGWGKSKQKSRDREVEPPERTKMPSPGGGRWTMHCYATGEASPRALPAESVRDDRERARRAMHRAAITLSTPAGVVGALESTSWLPFFEQPAPRLPPGNLGFDLAVEYGQERLQAYVWGQRGADWGRTGVFTVRVLDRFQVNGGVWSSEVTRSPWVDELSAAAAFGQGAGGGSASWQFEADVSGREGLLLVRQPSQAQLFVVAEGRAVTPIRGADAIVRTSGVVKLGSSWHFGAPTTEGFGIYKIVGDQVALVNVYPFDEARSGLRVQPKLIRNTDGDSVAIFLDSTARYIYPVNLLDGSLLAPLTIEPAAVASLPPSCTGDESGFVFVDNVKVAPYVELMEGAAAVNATRVEARYISTSDGVCVDTLAAQASALLPESLRRGNMPRQQGQVPVPMVLSEQAASARRWRFSCYP